MIGREIGVVVRVVDDVQRHCRHNSAPFGGERVSGYLVAQ